MGTSIEASSTNAKPIRLRMGGTGRGVESLLDSTSTYCGELLGVMNKARLDLFARKQRQYDMPNMLLMRLDTCGDKH